MAWLVFFLADVAGHLRGAWPSWLIVGAVGVLIQSVWPAQSVRIPGRLTRSARRCLREAGFRRVRRFPEEWVWDERARAEQRARLEAIERQGSTAAAEEAAGG